MENLFFTALKERLRFNYKGVVSTEDLFDLTEEQLNELYQKLAKGKKEVSEVSLLEVADEKSSLIDFQMQVVKEVFSFKRDQRLVKEDGMRKAQERRRLLELLDKKQQEKLTELTEEEILKRLEEM